MSPGEAAQRRAHFEAEEQAALEQRGRALLREGTELLHDGQAAQAAIRLEEAVRLLPDEPDAAVNLGGAYIVQRRHNKAVAVLEAASQRHPDHAMLWVNLAAAYLGTLEISGPQQQARAIAAFQRALAIDADTPYADYNLGLIYQDRGELDLARRHFERSLEILPGDRNARYWLEKLEELPTE